MLTHFQGERACMGARAVTALSITALLVFCACICTHNYELSDTIALTQSRHLLHNQIRTVEDHLVLIFGSTVFKTTKLLLTILLVVHLYTCVYWIVKVRLHFEHPLTAQSALLKLLSLLMLCQAAHVCLGAARHSAFGPRTRPQHEASELAALSEFAGVSG